MPSDLTRAKLKEDFFRLMERLAIQKEKREQAWRFFLVNNNMELSAEERAQQIKEDFFKLMEQLQPDMTEEKKEQAWRLFLANHSLEHLP